MNPISEVKKVIPKNKWVLFALGVLAGGTVLAGLVAMLVGRAKGLASKVGASAEKISASVGATK